MDPRQTEATIHSYTQTNGNSQTNDGRHTNGNGHANGNGNGHGGNGFGANGHGANGSVGADVRALHDASGVVCGGTIELIVFRFVSYGRLAHFRRELQALPHVSGVKIAGYEGQAARFHLAVNAGTVSGALVLRGTRLLSATPARVELCVEA